MFFPLSRFRLGASSRPRLQRLGIFVAALATAIGLAALGLVVVMARDVAKAYAASDAPNTAKQPAETKAFYPAWLEDFNILGPEATHSPYFGLPLAYTGGMDTTYPQMRGSHDVVPLVRIRLTLPPGVRIVKYHFNIAPPCKDGKYQLYPCSWVPPSNRGWQMVGGKPTWTWRGLRMTPRAAWDFRLNVPGNDRVVCIKAEAQAFFYRKVRRGGRTYQLLAPIPHAPVEYAQTAACTMPPNTTTTATTSP